MAWDLTKRLPAYPEVSMEQLKLYFSYLSLKGVKRYAAMMADIEPTRIQSLIGKNDELAVMQSDAIEMYKERLELELLHRAVEGERKAVRFKGKIVGHELVKSDKLFEVLLKATIPEKYKNAMQLDGNITAGVLVVNATLDPDDWEDQYGDMRIDTSRLDACSSQPSEPKKCDGD